MCIRRADGVNTYRHSVLGGMLALIENSSQELKSQAGCKGPRGWLRFELSEVVMFQLLNMNHLLLNLFDPPARILVRPEQSRRIQIRRPNQGALLSPTP